MRILINHSELVVLFLSLALSGFSGSDGSGDGQFELTLSSEAPPTLSAGSVALVSLYGYDSNIADAEATEVATFELPVGEWPQVFSLTLPAVLRELIDQGHGLVKKAEARFYFSIEVDLNSDGKLCNGDFGEDYGLNGSDRFSGSVAPSYEMRMIALERDWCENDSGEVVD